MTAIRLLVTATVLFLYSSLVQAANIALPSFAPLVQQVSPSVVSISTVSLSKNQTDDSASDDGKSLPTPAHLKSLGSGVIVASNGTIVTSRHVILGHHAFYVRLADKRLFKARLLGSDVNSDIAALKIEGKGLRGADVTPKAMPRPGEWVLALSMTTDTDPVMDAGIVSSSQRTLNDEGYNRFIQTSIGDRKGMTGSPVFNVDGAVVGITTPRVVAGEPLTDGFSFAVPIKTAMQVADQLQKKGEVKHGWLGIIIQEVDQDLAESFGLKDARGALVSKVYPGGPAAKAGIKEGDIIVSFDGRAVERVVDLPRLVGTMQPGQSAALHVIRQGKSTQLSVTLGEKGVDKTQHKSTSREASSSHYDSLGLKVEALESDADQDSWNGQRGVVVTDVNSGAAAQAGVMVGDIITMLDGKLITSLKQFEQVVKSLPKARLVPIRIVRRGTPRFLPMKIAE